MRISSQQDPDSSSGFSLAWRKLFSRILIILSLCGVSGFFVIRGIAIWLPYQFNYAEGGVWWQAAHITDPKLAYKSLDRYPYVGFEYPPIYHLVSRGLEPLAGDWIAAGRLVSLLSASGIVIVLSALLLRVFPAREPILFRAAAAAFASGALFLNNCMRWSGMARVDVLALFLSILGIATFAICHGNTKGQLAAVGLFVLSLYTKQTTLAAPAACLLVLMLVNPVRALRLGLFAVVLGSIPLLYLTSVTHGGFLLNTFTYNINNEFSLSRMLLALQRFWVVELPIGLMALVEVSLFWTGLLQLHRRHLRKRLRLIYRQCPLRRLVLLLSVNFILATPQTLALAKVGSDTNYFLEVHLLSCALAGIFVFRLLCLWHGRTIRLDLIPALSGGVILVYILLLLPFRMAPLLVPHARRKHEREQTVAFEQGLAYVRRFPGLVYSDDMTLSMRAGKDVFAESSIITLLANAGVWNETPFVEMILARKFDLIVTERPPFPERYSVRVWKAIEAAYAVSETFNPNYTFYVPRSQSHQR